MFAPELTGSSPPSKSSNSNKCGRVVREGPVARATVPAGLMDAGRPIVVRAARPDDRSARTTGMRLNAASISQFDALE